MASAGIRRFATALPNIECLLLGDKQILRFQAGAARCTVSAEESFSGGGVHNFQIYMKVKAVKTAVGLLSRRQTTEYMRDTPLAEPHVSYGGAGWIHPKEIAAVHKYREGDKVKVEVDLDRGVVRFYVNGALAGEDVWSEEKAFPAVSADGGPCELEVTF